MEPGEALSTAAQIAVALAGFAGVVVVFRRESVHDWSTLDKFRLRLLLADSILPLGLCMIALLLLTVEPMPPDVWRWCSVVTFVVFFGIRDRDTHELSPHRPKAVTRRIRQLHLLFVRHSWVGSDPVAIAQYRLARRVLAILRQDRSSACRRHVPVSADGSFVASMTSDLLEFGSGATAKTTPLIRCREDGCNRRSVARRRARYRFRQTGSRTEHRATCNPSAFEPTRRSPDRFPRPIL